MQNAHITILVATSGQRLKVMYRGSMKVQQLKTAIANQTGIPLERQILLYNNSPLSNEKTLLEYVEGQAGQKSSPSPIPDRLFMYLFDTNLLSSDSQYQNYLAQFEEISGVAISEELRSVQGQGQGQFNLRSGSDSSPTYELGNVQFTLDEYERIGKQIQSKSELRLNYAKTETSEIEVQAACIRYAMDYFRSYYDRHISKFEDNLRECREQLKKHEELRIRIDQDLEFIRIQNLHPDLLKRQNKWKYLIDVMGASKTQETVDDYKSIQLQVQKLTQQGDDDIQALMHMIRQATDDSNDSSQTVDMNLMRREAEEKLNQLNYIQSLVLLLSQGRNEMMEKCMSAIGQPQRLAEQLSVFRELSKKHESILNDLANHDMAMEDFRKFCRDQKSEVVKQLTHVFAHIQSVQHKNRSMEKKMVSLLELLRRENETYVRVQRIHQFPFIYLQSLADCARRKIWNARYQEVAHLGQQKLETIRETQSEVQRQFNQKVEPVLGEELIELMGLNKPPPNNSLEIHDNQNFVKSLVQVDVNYLNTIQRQLPPYLQPKLKSYLSSSAYKSMGVPSSSSSSRETQNTENMKSLKSQIQTLEMEKLWLSQRVIEEVVGRFEILMKIGRAHV
eukprot:TRINITY_DN3096_c0_g2_i1.p1 TRINITY_DN3096_c0_g2~~TRINITY_DN3096_c0_g2_i1.p1  ORF type:complete len:619 (-),score=52.38 TRINITY_DN3096_c0_g2_i1:59-1915(-)